MKRVLPRGITVNSCSQSAFTTDTQMLSTILFSDYQLGAHKLQLFALVTGVTHRAEYKTYKHLSIILLIHKNDSKENLLQASFCPSIYLKPNILVEVT